MKKVETKAKRHLNFKLVALLLVIFSIITLFLLIKSNLFSILTIILMVLFTGIIDFLFVKGLTSKLKVWCKNVLSFFVLILIIIQILFYIFGNKAIIFLSSIIDNGIRTYTYDVYVLDKSDYKELKDINNKIISYIMDDNINEVKDKIGKEIQYKTRISDDINKLMDSIINEEVDAVIIEQSYVDVIKEYNETDFNKLRKIHSVEITTKIKVERSNKNIMDKPFVVYISGIDTMGKINSNARSDVNLLLAVNLNKKEIKMVSTPRDYYIDLPTKGKKDKLTHSGLYGIDETMKSLSKLYDVNIDYYVRINFSSFINIIDKIGGVDVDIEDKFCESNEERSLKKNDLICIDKGLNNLNGKQALAYARNRHAFANGDISRGNHQMQILTATINKLTNKDILSNYNDIIDSLKGQVLTNINIDDIYKVARKQLKDNSSFKIESYTPKIKDMNKLADCYSVGDWAYVLIGDDDSVKEISDSLKSTLN